MCSMTVWIIIAIIILLIIAVLAISYHDTHTFVVKNYEVETDKLDRDYTYVFLTDLHGYVYGNKNDTLIKAIDDIAPDAVLCAGDMVTARKIKNNVEIDSGLRLLEELSSRYPVYISNGNHEQKVKSFTNQYQNTFDRYKNRLIRSGASYLENRSELIEGHNIRVSGLCLSLDYFKKVVKKQMEDGLLDKELGPVNGTQKNVFQILIAHNPVYFKEYAEWGADLVLSGHVHGGIVRLPLLGGVISPAIALFPKYDGGKYEMNGSTMILSCGLGTHTIHVRVFNPGEVSVIKVRGKKNVT